MSKYVLLSDIHGNAVSLEAVIDAEGTDVEYLVLGDIHGLCGYPAKTVELLQSLDATIIAGNHDKALFHHDEGHVNSDILSEYEYEHTINSLTRSQQDWMLQLPFMKVITRSGDRICLAHSYPWLEQASGYELGNAGVTKATVTSVASVVADDYDYVFIGHTHQQYDLDCSQFEHDVHFANPGSLGYDETYLTFDQETGKFEHKSVDIDRDMVRAHIDGLTPDSAPSSYTWY